MFDVMVGSPAYSFFNYLYFATYFGVIIAAVIYVIKTVNRLTGLLDRMVSSNERIAERLDAEEK